MNGPYETGRCRGIAEPYRLPTSPGEYLCYVRVCFRSGTMQEQATDA